MFVPFALLVAVLAAAQPEHISVHGNPVCESCRIAFREVARAGKSDGHELLSHGAALFASGDGREAVLDLFSYPSAVLYRPGRSTNWVVLGRQGKGPGEFRQPTRVRFDDSLMHVYDIALLRETRFRRNGELAGMTNLAVGGEILPLGEGRTIVSGQLRLKGHIGNPVHLVDREGGVVRSFGSDTAMLLPGKEYLAARVASLSPRKTIWLSRVNEYRIEEWDTIGNHLRTVTRHTGWFGLWLTPTQPMRVRPQPWLAGVWEEDGLLWTLAHVADEHYRPVMRPGEDDHSRAITQDVGHRVWDTVIEVIDLERRAVLANVRVDEHLRPFVQGGFLSHYRQTKSGAARLVIWKPILVQSTPKERP